MACSSLSHSLPRSVSTATTQPEPAGRRQSCLDTQCPAVLHNARQVSNRSAQSTVIHTHTHTHTHHTHTHAHPTHTRTYARAHTPHTHTHHTHIHTYIHTRTHHAHTRTHTHTTHTHTRNSERPKGAGGVVAKLQQRYNGSTAALRRRGLKSATIAFRLVPIRYSHFSHISFVALELRLFIY